MESSQAPLGALFLRSFFLDKERTKEIKAQRSAPRPEFLRKDK
jgi:hypothetical protein